MRKVHRPKVQRNSGRTSDDPAEIAQQDSVEGCGSVHIQLVCGLPDGRTCPWPEGARREKFLPLRHWSRSSVDQKEGRNSQGEGLLDDGCFNSSREEMRLRSRSPKKV